MHSYFTCRCVFWENTFIINSIAIWDVLVNKVVLSENIKTNLQNKFHVHVTAFTKLHNIGNLFVEIAGTSLMFYL